MTASSTLNKGLNNNIAALNISQVILKTVSRTARLKLTVKKVKKIFSICTLRLVDPSLHCKGNSSILSGLTHQPDYLVMRRVDNRDVINGNDFIAAEQTPIEICSSSRNNVTN